MATAKYYAIKAKRGCWGSVNRYVDSLVARVDGAASASEALEKFRSVDVRRQEFDGEFEAIPASRLNASDKEWIENYVEEVLKG